MKTMKTLEFPVLPGDLLARVDEVVAGGVKTYKLTTGEVKSLTIEANDLKVKCTTFSSVDLDTVVETTELLEADPKAVVLYDMFVLTDELKARVEKWIEYANESKEKIRCTVKLPD